MAILKCKMCGGDLDVTAGSSICACDYCGTKQTVPTVKEEGLAGLFNRANALRMKNEFDKAESLYEKILQNDDRQAEAYWGLILCKYGIEYVEDPTTFARIPTCHRTSFDSVMADEDYQAALRCADGVQKSLYEAEAKEIDRLQKEILTLSQNEEPYDVFLCYKETDAAGQRTVDSVIANDIYHQLTQEGFKVFYAAITLEDKLGSAYEPCIFAALNSAKVMLAIGTKPEHFAAVWVKNEWSRFLKMMKTDRSKTLIPCYRDMDAYDLPLEFAHLQAQDMSKIGFINDVVRGIKKLIVKEAAPAPAAAPVGAATAAAPATGTVQLMLEGNVMYEGEVFANIPHGQGKATYENGDVYEGQWSRGNRHGQGNITWGAGGAWAGEFKDGKCWTGKGTFYVPADDILMRYDGDLQEGKRHGYGTLQFADSVYEGEWANGKKNGQGKIIWNKGGEWAGTFHDNKQVDGTGRWYYADSYYDGPMVNGNRHGQGKLTWAKGGEWIGEFIDNKFWNGQGTVRYKSGCYTGDYAGGQRQGHGKYVETDTVFYEGQWQNDARNGSGVQRYNHGVYTGVWVDNDRHGQGEMVWDDGDVFEGTWEEDNFVDGVMTWAKGGTFQGEFRDGSPWAGKGTIHYADGECYEGDYADDQRHGYGKFTDEDGVYEGEWANGKKNGQGKMVWAKGGEWVGEFKDDKPWTGKGTFYVPADSKGEKVLLRYDGDLIAGIRKGYGVQRYTDSVYEGEWVGGKWNGQGKITWNKGGEWVGEFKDGKRWKGAGRWYYTDGYYDGPMVNGNRQGQGKMTWAKGGEWAGEFRDNKQWNGSGFWYYNDSYFICHWVNGVREGEGRLVWNAGGEWVGEFKNGQRWKGTGTVHYTNAPPRQVVTKRGKDK